MTQLKRSFTDKLMNLSLNSIFSRIGHWQFHEIELGMEDFCSAMIGDDSPSTLMSIKQYQREFYDDEEFFLETNKLSFKARRKCAVPAGWSVVHYIITRILRPKVIVETGVFDGHSSACWLLALKKNAFGKLISIDLPAKLPISNSVHLSLPEGYEPGWLIPRYLKDRHELILGDAKHELPIVLKNNFPIDIFFHDSLHTLEHMLFEFRQSCSKMKRGGIILSDDYKSYNAFGKFAKGIKLKFCSYNGLGGVRL